MRMQIRKAVPGDLPAMVELYHQTIESVNAADYAPEFIAAWSGRHRDILTRFAERLTNQFFLVAEIDGLLVGFASMASNGYLDLLYVHYQWQRRQVASRMYEGLMAEARRNGIASFTTDASLTARAFFEKKGWTIVSENHGVLDGISYINYRMQLWREAAGC